VINKKSKTPILKKLVSKRKKGKKESNGTAAQGGEHQKLPV
jgi:hypothetical protein